MPDRELTCAGCEETFVFTEKEQEFHLSRGLTSAPRRCPACREKAPDDTAEMVAVTDTWDAPCSQCGTTTTVPFDPADGRPVYCRPCVEKGSQA